MLYNVVYTDLMSNEWVGGRSTDIDSNESFVNVIGAEVIQGWVPSAVYMLPDEFATTVLQTAQLNCSLYTTNFIRLLTFRLMGLKLLCNCTSFNNNSINIPLAYNIQQ